MNPETFTKELARQLMYCFDFEAQADGSVRVVTPLMRPYRVFERVSVLVRETGTPGRYCITSDRKLPEKSEGGASTTDPVPLPLPGVEPPEQPTFRLNDDRVEVEANLSELGFAIWSVAQFSLVAHLMESLEERFMMYLFERKAARD